MGSTGNLEQVPFDCVTDSPRLTLAVDDQRSVSVLHPCRVYATEQSVSETALDATHDEDIRIVGRTFDGAIGPRLDDPRLDRSLTQVHQFGEVNTLLDLGSLTVYAPD